MQVKVTKTTNNLEKLMKRLRTLAENKVQSGYFKEQGVHPDADGMTFAELMNFHEYGFGNVPARPVAKYTIRLLKQQIKDINFEVKKLVRNQKDADDVLNFIGWKITKIATSIFGDTRYLIDNSEYTQEIKGRNDPLVDTGLLKYNWSWKNSIDNFLKNLHDV